MKFIKPVYTSISEIVDVGDGWIILESRFNHPDHKSNLYKVNQDFKLVWIAKDRGCKAKYEILAEEGGVLKVYDNYGRATLDPHTGETINCEVSR